MCGDHGTDENDWTFVDAHVGALLDANAPMSLEWADGPFGTMWRMTVPEGTWTWHPALALPKQHDGTHRLYDVPVLAGTWIWTWASGADVAAELSGDTLDIAHLLHHVEGPLQIKQLIQRQRQPLPTASTPQNRIVAADGHMQHGSCAARGGASVQCSPLGRTEADAPGLPPQSMDVVAMQGLRLCAKSCGLAAISVCTHAPLAPW